MKSGTIYCEFSGAIREAFRAQGWDMWSCDLLPSDDNSPNHIQGDAISAALERSGKDRFAGVHWPCTWFTNAGVKWMYLKGHSRNGPNPERAHAMRLSAFSLGKLLNILLDAGVPFYFENPVMHGFAFDAITRNCEWFSIAEMRSVQPWNFGIWETKRTCLWLNKLPPLIPKYRTIDECRIALGLPEFVMGEDGQVKNKPVAKVHLMSPGPNRGHERSRTLPSLAKAMAEQWGGLMP